MGSDSEMNRQEHGGNICDGEIRLDFSVNLNPFGMPENVRKSVISHCDLWEKYPDHNCYELRKKLAEKHGVSIENIVCGNGADDLIFRIVQAFRPKKCLITAPTFSEYKKAVLQNNGKITEYPLRKENNFSVENDITDYITDDTDMIFLCNPNNPTGKTISPEILCNAAEKCLETGRILVCDECFMEFTGNAEKLGLFQFMNKNTIIIKAFTKTYAMAGLRLGYAIFGDIEKAEKTERTGQFWSVSSPAQTAGISALSENEYLRESVEYVKNEREYLSEQLEKIGMKVYPSEVNYILFYSETELYEKMLSEKILIRDCSEYSNLGKGFYRIGIKVHEDNMCLIDTLRRVMNG